MPEHPGLTLADPALSMWALLMPLPIWIIQCSSEAELPLCIPCSTSRKAELEQQGCAGCSRAQSVPQTFLPAFHLSREGWSFLRSSITALWDPTIMLCGGFKLHEVSSKNHDTKQSQHLSDTYSLSTAQCPWKTNLQAILTAMQSPARPKNRHVKVTCSHSSHCRCVLPP